MTSSRVCINKTGECGSTVLPLLLVPFDDRGRTHLGLIRILAELAPRFPLAQQIPTLIELDLDGFQPHLIVIGQFALPVEMLLLVNKTFDFLQDGMISRRFSHVNHLAHAFSGTFSVSLSGFRTVDSGSLAGKRPLDGFVKCGLSAEPFLLRCMTVQRRTCLHGSARLDNVF
jgi:hypothetical protein